MQEEEGGGLAVQHVVIAHEARLAVGIVHVTYSVADVIVERGLVRGNDDVAVLILAICLPIWRLKN